jgi:hypothetical protein
MLVTLLGIVMSVRSPQPVNALSLIAVTPGGMTTLVRPESVNALSPMLVTLFGIVMAVRSPQLSNARFPILVTLFGIVTSARFVQQ